jgi:hypothetical protein
MSAPAVLDSAHIDANPQAIVPHVEVELGYSPAVHRTRVRFTVRNGAARNGIERFAVTNVVRPLTVHSPNQWTAWYGWLGNDSAVVWSDVDTLTPPPAGYAWQKYPSRYGVMPGDTALVFTMFIRKLPPVIHWYAQGFDTIPGMNVPNPPTLFTSGWTGTIHFDGAPDRRTR